MIEKFENPYATTIELFKVITFLSLKVNRFMGVYSQVKSKTVTELVEVSYFDLYLI
jgi:hypothetical protein